MAAGQEAGVWVPLPVRRVPLLLHHDGVQRVHLCELAHVWGLTIGQATCRGSGPPFLCNTRPGRTRVMRPLEGCARGVRLSHAVHRPPLLSWWPRLSLPPPLLPVLLVLPPTQPPSPAHPLPASPLPCEDPTST